jgi:hypothetical protein
MSRLKLRDPADSRTEHFAELLPPMDQRYSAMNFIGCTRSTSSCPVACAVVSPVHWHSMPMEALGAALLDLDMPSG